MSAPDDEPPAEAGDDGARDGKGRILSPPPDDEPVGYGRPPKRHQFQPGRSGNPRGRPKSAPGLRSILKKELGARVHGTINGKRTTMSKLQYVVRKMTDKAMSGDQKAIQQLITLNIAMFGLDEAQGTTEAPLTDGEIAFLNAVTRRPPSSDEAAGHPAAPQVSDQGDDGE